MADSRFPCEPYAVRVALFQSAGRRRTAWAGTPLRPRHSAVRLGHSAVKPPTGRPRFRVSRGDSAFATPQPLASPPAVGERLLEGEALMPEEGVAEGLVVGLAEGVTVCVVRLGRALEGRGVGFVFTGDGGLVVAAGDGGACDSR